jgi:transcription factor C subunit 7
LSEWYSPVAPNTGLHPRPGSATSLQAYFPQIDPEGWSPTLYPSRKGENVDEVHDRADEFLKVFIPAVEARYPEHKRILLVSHAATVITLVRALGGDRQMPVRIGCCSLSEAVLKDGKWELGKIADGAHLEKGASRDWGFEDIEIAHGKVGVLYLIWDSVCTEVCAQVVDDPGVPGTENEIDEIGEPVGSQVTSSSLSRM